jgi:hypothetical protein
MDSKQYERALKRAEAEGIVIVGDSISPDGRRSWDVFNPKYSEGWYTVRQARAGVPLTCKCDAGRHSTLCKHVARVIADEHLPHAEARLTVGQLRADRMQAASLWS